MIKSAIRAPWLFLLATPLAASIAGVLPASAGELPPYQAGVILAQAGSIGGTVGTQNKSISGGETENPPPDKTVAPKTPSAPRRDLPVVLGRGVDGTWAGISVGQCIGQYAWSIQISQGTISGSATTGQVSRNGATRGDMVVLGTHYIFTGFTSSGGHASGTWTTGTCSGTWTAVRSS